MIDPPLDKIEVARRFAEETDDIASRSAGLDCTEQLASFHAWFHAECLEAER